MSGPLFLTVTVHFTVSPRFGFVLLTSLVTSKSTASGTLIDASALLLLSSLSGSFPVTLAIFLIVPVFVTLDTMFKVAV